MKKIMREFVKHHKEFLLRGEPAVDRNVVLALQTEVKTAYFQRHLFDNNFVLSAELVKISLDQRTFVPGNTQAGDCISEQEHDVLYMGHCITLVGGWQCSGSFAISALRNY